MERNSIRRLFTLTGALVILALGFAAVLPVLAQDGGQGGSNVTVGADDSLGDIMEQYSFTEEQIAEFLRQNGNLVIETGETVTFPAGVTVNTGESDAGGNAGGAAQATPTTDAAGAGGAQETPTADAGGGAGQATPTADAGGAAQATPTTDAGGAGGAGADQGFVCEVGDAQAGDTYVTQDGDTLGDVLGMMGFQVDNAGGTGGNTGGTGTQATTNQVVEFVYLNCDLDFEDDQTVVIPAGIPQTGGEGEAQATPTADAGGAQATPTADAGGAAQATPTAQAGGAGGGGVDPTATPQAGGAGGIPQTGSPGSVVADFGPGGNASLNLHLGRNYPLNGRGVYVVQSGDTLSTIARRFNTTVADLMAMNTGIPDQNLIFRGQRLIVPGGEFPGQWNNNLLDIDPRVPNSGQNNNGENSGEGGG